MRAPSSACPPPSRRLGNAWPVVAALVLSVGCSELNPARSGSFGSGTPDPGPDRGVPLFQAAAGNFTVEVRQYGAGKGGRESSFCDYWVRYKGHPIPSTPELNLYNSCKALLITDEANPRLIIGAYASSQGDYVPVFFEERNGDAVVSARRDCALTSGTDEQQQAIAGWAVQDGQVTICGERLTVRQPAAP